MSNEKRNEKTLIATKDGEGAALAIRVSQYPSTDIIEILEKHNPGSAGRILEMVEREQAHNHKIEIKKVELKEIEIISNWKLPLIGIITAFTLCVLCLGIGAWLLYLNKDVAGYAALLAPLSLLVKSIFTPSEKRNPPTPRP